MRIGFGYDSHRFTAGRLLILAGQLIPFGQGLSGHSDADAVAHALIDAMLGAAALGNIGTLFPDSDQHWKDADSMKLLRTAYDLVLARGWKLAQADITIIVEQPRLAPHLPAMSHALADAVGVQDDAISVKPKTNEGMGFIGRGEGLAVMAVVLLEAR
ncbi:MAG: 2-C-methyl-D-erythritol 2,4-cyclodiphosphate synthase [Gemmatimonadota bacterium]